MNSIIIVDDDRVLPQLFVQILVQHGYIATLVSTKQEALAIVEAFHPDLILIDSRLPGISNQDFKAQIFAHHPTARIVGYSSFNKESTGAKELIKVFGEFLEKPKDITQLIADIKALSNEHNGER